MLPRVLRSQRAVEVSIAIMRTFVQLRRLMDSNRDLARKIQAMEKKYDEQFAVVFNAIKQLIAEDEARKAHPKRHRLLIRQSSIRHGQQELHLQDRRSGEPRSESFL